jgi:hypothetical protein
VVRAHARAGQHGQDAVDPPAHTFQF